MSWLHEWFHRPGKTVLRQKPERMIAAGHYVALPTASIDYLGAHATTDAGDWVCQKINGAYIWVKSSIPDLSGTGTRAVEVSAAGVFSATRGLMGTLLATFPFSAVATASFPANTFTATYRQYLVVMRATLSASANLTWRLRAAGSDDSNSTYFSAIAGFLSAAPSLQNNGTTAQSSGYIQTAIGTTNGEFFTHLLIDAPQLAERTEWESTSTARATTPSTIINFGGGHFNNTTVFDSLTLIPASGTFTGTAWCYGLTGV